MTSRKDEARKLMELAEQIERLSRREHDFQTPLAAVLRQHAPRGLTGHDWDDRDAFHRMRELLALMPKATTALRAQLTRNHNGDK